MPGSAHDEATSDNGSQARLLQSSDRNTDPGQEIIPVPSTLGDCWQHHPVICQNIRKHALACVPIASIARDQVEGISSYHL